MFRIGIITKLGNIYGASFKTRSEVDDYILNLNEKEPIKRADILDEETQKREHEEF